MARKLKPLEEYLFQIAVQTAACPGAGAEQRTNAVAHATIWGMSVRELQLQPEIPQDKTQKPPLS